MALAVQWRLNRDNNGLWTLQSVGGGKYLGIEGDAGNGVKLIAQDNQTQWDIKPDERDHSDHRYVVDGDPSD
jgi:hypothetical protein